MHPPAIAAHGHPDRVPSLLAATARTASATAADNSAAANAAPANSTPGYNSNSIYNYHYSNPPFTSFMSSGRYSALASDALAVTPADLATFPPAPGFPRKTAADYSKSAQQCPAAAVTGSSVPLPSSIYNNNSGAIPNTVTSAVATTRPSSSSSSLYNTSGIANVLHNSAPDPSDGCYAHGEPCTCICGGAGHSAARPGQVCRYPTAAASATPAAAAVGSAPCVPTTAECYCSCSRGCAQYHLAAAARSAALLAARSMHPTAPAPHTRRGDRTGVVRVRVDAYSNLDAADGDRDSVPFVVNRAVLVAEREAALLAWKRRRWEAVLASRTATASVREQEVDWSFSTRRTMAAESAVTNNIVKRAVSYARQQQQQRRDAAAAKQGLRAKVRSELVTLQSQLTAAKTAAEQQAAAAAAAGKGNDALLARVRQLERERGVLKAKIASFDQAAVAEAEAEAEAAARDDAEAEAAAAAGAAGAATADDAGALAATVETMPNVAAVNAALATEQDQEIARLTSQLQLN